MRLALPHESRILENGLKVVLHQDRSLPLVAVNLWYRVGSKDEPPGRTGFAHLFEHLMFMGTDRVPGDAFDRIMEAHGGANNATTSPDRTNYYSYGPSNILPILLYLEADRMANLGASMTLDKLDLQRKVVRNERRQSYENRPYGRTWLAMPGLFYPEGHPYHHPTIGSHADIEAATVEDVRAFFETWYRPNNASLAIAGDFDRDAAIDLIDSLFGEIPPGKAPPRRTAPDHRLARCHTALLEDEVPAARTVLAFSSPRQFEPGDAECDVIASILADGNSSRLERLLVHETGLATDVAAFQSEGALASELVVIATAAPGRSIEEIESAILNECRHLRSDGAKEEEIARAVAGVEASAIRGLQSIQERADLLNQYLTYLGEPDRIEWDIDRYRRITVSSLNGFLRNGFDVERYARLRIMPGKRPPSETGDEAEEERDLPPGAPAAATPLAGAPAAGPRPLFIAPEPEVAKAGPLPLWHLGSPRAPLISLELILPAGGAADAPRRIGEGEICASLLTEGAGELDSARFAEAVDILGSHISVRTGRHCTSLQIWSLERHLERTLDLAAMALLSPRFEDKDFQRIKTISLAHLQQRDNHPDHVALIVAQGTLLASFEAERHPISGYRETVQSIERSHAADRHRQWLSVLPGASIVSAGSPDASSVADLAARKFGLLGLDAVPAPPPAPLPPAEPGPLRVLVVPREGAPQTVIRMMTRSVPMGAPESAAIRLANAIFGGSFTSRLNQNLRERHGFTYGAGSSFRQGPALGIWTAATSVKAETTGRAVEELLAEIERLRTEPFSEAELDKARASERTDRIQGFESTAAMVGTLSPYAAAKFPPEQCSADMRAIETATLDEVRTRGIAPIAAEGAVLVLLGDDAKIRAQIDHLGLRPEAARIAPPEHALR